MLNLYLSCCAGSDNLGLPDWPEVQCKGADCALMVRWLRAYCFQFRAWKRLLVVKGFPAHCVPNVAAFLGGPSRPVQLVASYFESAGRLFDVMYGAADVYLTCRERLKALTAGRCMLHCFGELAYTHDKLFKLRPKTCH